MSLLLLSRLPRRLPPSLPPSPRPVCHFSAFSEGAFHAVASAFLESVQDACDVLDDAHPEAGVDSSYASGVLNIRLGERGTWVINKQAPNRQIWYSSPISGPARFGFEGGRWVHTREGVEIGELFGREVREATGLDIELEEPQA
ncbi:hypothetical protein TeGR_g12586 [Tetraparma gracilis]|uniref:ferroxidase n=1 Tax=Tetraparma gracilis TaxID=2962635 RepID=A0ABQ6M849_9STRA|nr:hypothetical protein TeGR_g12586 [Tetraparma gracilis]